MIKTFDDNFNVTWDDPAMAEQTFAFDAMHFPRPMVPLAAEFLQRMYREFMSCETIFVNDFAYSTPLTPRAPTDAIIQRGVLDVWTKDLQPEIETVTRGVRDADYATMTLPRLGEAVDKAVLDSIKAFGNTMIPITGFMGPTFAMVGFLQEAIGPEGPRLAAALLQGQENRSAAAGVGISELTRVAAAHPEVAAAIRAGNYDDLRSLPGGAEFGKALDRFLADYGWRVESWGQMETPTWAEDPAPLFGLIGRYLDGPGELKDAVEHASEQREAARKEVDSKLNAAQRQQLNGMLEAARAHVPVSEGRALWQLITIGSLRMPVLALGRALVAAGALSEASDALYLTVAELKAAANNPSSATKQLAARRRADHARWEKLTPPPFIGPPVDPTQLPPEMIPLVTLFFGAGAPEVEGQVIKGQAASRGEVTATARVIRDLADSHRLQDGEILVCATTSPPWASLFAIASAVVTDSGGVLSHSAICAREYGIPCVVATQVATQLIPDGATITVDGSAGTVRIEG